MIRKFFRDTYHVALSDIYYFKRNLLNILATSLITPLLYLVAFGYGMGQGVVMDGVPYIAFMIPGVVAMTTMTASFTSVSSKLMVQKRYYESFDELKLCPISNTSIILGKAVFGMVKALLCSLILLGIGMMFTDSLHITWQLIAMMLIASATFSMLGVAAGVIVSDLPHMNLFSSFVILPMTFLCGTMFSLDALPDFAKALIELLPLTHVSYCIRSTALGWEFSWFSLMITIIYGVMFYILARYGLRDSN